MTRNKYKKRRYSKKSKWREQKISVGTIQKIARTIAKQEDNKNLEHLFTTHVIGVASGGVDDSPAPRLVTREGLSNPTNATKDVILFHPFTKKMQFTTGSDIVKSGNGYRKGDEIFVTGIGVRGYIVVPNDMMAGTIRITVFHADQHFSDLWDKQTDLDNMMLKRSLDEDEYKVKVLMRKEYNFTPWGAGANVTKRINVNMYKKINRKIHYNDGLIDEDGCNQADFKDRRYLLSIISNVPVYGTPVDLDKNVKFQGMFNCYYTDA